MRHLKFLITTIINFNSPFILSKHIYINKIKSKPKEQKFTFA